MYIRISAAVLVVHFQICIEATDWASSWVSSLKSSWVAAIHSTQCSVPIQYNDLSMYSQPLCSLITWEHRFIMKISNFKYNDYECAFQWSMCPYNLNTYSPCSCNTTSVLNGSRSLNLSWQTHKNDACECATNVTLMQPLRLLINT